MCRRGGTGRRTGLKILRDLPPVPVRFRSPAYFFKTYYVGLAQLDRAFGYGPKGREFESSSPRTKDTPYGVSFFIIFILGKDEIYDMG